MPPLFYPTKLFSNIKYRHIFIVSKKYKSPLGYETGNGGVDSFGIDHSQFSVRDEIEYQTAREEHEN